MARFWASWRSPLREAPTRASFLGLALILVIWLATAFHLLTFRHQAYEAFRQNSANLARAFEQDVVQQEVDWTIRLLRTYYTRKDPSFDFAGLIRELTKADGLTFQYVIIGPDGSCERRAPPCRARSSISRTASIFAFIATQTRIGSSSAHRFSARLPANGRFS
jgi:hypothetical protein